MQTFGYACNVDFRVCMQCLNSSILEMQTFGCACNVDIWVCMQCRQSGMHAMQTFGYACNVDIWLKIAIRIQEQCMNSACGKSRCRQHFNVTVRTKRSREGGGGGGGGSEERGCDQSLVTLTVVHATVNAT